MIFSSSVTFIDNNQPNIGDVPCASITWRWKICNTCRTLLFACPEPTKPKVWGVTLNENSERWSSLQVLQYLDRGNQRTLDRTWLWGKEAHMQLWTCWYWCSNPVQQVNSFSSLTNVTFLHTVRFVICTKFYIVYFLSAVMIVVFICWCMLNIGMDVQCNISRRVTSLIYASFYCISG